MQKVPQWLQIRQRERIDQHAGVGRRRLDQAQLREVRALAHELGVERDEIARDSVERALQIVGVET